MPDVSPSAILAYPMSSFLQSSQVILFENMATDQNHLSLKSTVRIKKHRYGTTIFSREGIYFGARLVNHQFPIALLTLRFQDTAQRRSSRNPLPETILLPTKNKTMKHEQSHLELT
jgi:hypothetical protein